MSTFEVPRTWWVYLILVLTGQLLVGAVRPSPVPSEPFLRSMLPNPHVLVYFGDSSALENNEHAPDTRPLPAFLDLPPVVAIAVLMHQGWHLGIFRTYLDYMVRRGLLPGSVVVPISIRTFSAEFDPNPNFQFSHLTWRLYHDDWVGAALDPPLSVLKWFDDGQRESSYQDLPVLDGDTPVGRVRDFDNDSYQYATPENVQRKFVFHYMGSVKPDNRKLQDALSIASECDSHAIRLLFYIEPVDVEAGLQYIPYFASRVRDNVATVTRVLGTAGHPPLDLSSTLPDRAFEYDQYPTEHLKAAGRQQVAQALSRALRALLAP